MLSALEETLAHCLTTVVTSSNAGLGWDRVTWLVYSQVQMPCSGVSGGFLLQLTVAFKSVHTIAVEG